MQAANWPPDKCGNYLGPLLAGELQAAFQAANPTGATPISSLKKSILERLGLDEEMYRIRFRQERARLSDTSRALVKLPTSYL